MGFRAWALAEKKGNSDWTATAVNVVVTAADPTLLLIVFGPILIQQVLAVVAPQVPNVSVELQKLLRLPTVCGIVLFTVTLYTALLASVIFFTRLAVETLPFLTIYEMKTDRLSPGRRLRLTVTAVLGLVALYKVISLFVLGGAASDIMLYQFPHCYQPGDGFHVPPLESRLTQLRGILFVAQMITITLNLTPARWTPSITAVTSESAE